MPLDQPKTWAEALAAAPNPYELAIGRYARAPIAFVREVLGAEPDAWQLDVLRAFARGHTRVAVRSCHGPGKTATAAFVIIWFICTRAPFKVAVTAPSAAQLFDALWVEIGKWMQCLPKTWRDLWTVTAARIELKADSESFVTARTSRPETPEAMAGLHSDHVLLVADEASGIDEAVYEAAGGSMSSAGAVTLLIGNPVRSTGFFWRVFNTEQDRWFTKKVSYQDSKRVAPEYVEEMRQRYGESSNAFRIRCLGEFPLAEDDALIPADLVDAAMARDVPLDNVPEVWALDVARYGSDASCLLKRSGYVVTEPPRRWYGKNTMEVAGLVKFEWDNCARKPALIVIDSIGIGAGVVDRLHEQGLPILGINVGEQSSNKAQFMRLRDEMWWNCRDWLASRRVKLPKDEQLRNELCSIKFTHTSDGKLQVESKERLRARGLASPDAADALCLSLTDRGGMMTTSERFGGLNDPNPVMPPMIEMEV